MSKASTSGPGELAERKVAVMQVSGETTNFASGLYSDFCQRQLISFPCDTFRYRFRIRNYDTINSDAITEGALSYTGIYRGTPSYGSTGLWLGAFASAPTQLVGAFDTNADGSEYVSDWIEDASSQFEAGRVYGLSVGATCGSIEVARGYGGALQWKGSGAAADVGDTAAPSSGVISYTSGTAGDLRIEYEVLDYDQKFRTAIVIGDSWGTGTLGVASDDQLNGCYPHETWPLQLGERNKILVNNASLSGASSGDFSTATSSTWKYAKFLPGSITAPDYIIYALGINDADAAVATSTVNTRVKTTVDNIVSAFGGTPRVVLCTVPPCGLTAGDETARLAYNAERRDDGRFGATVLDFDKLLRDYTTPANAETDNQVTSLHPARSAYHRMGSLVL